MGSTNLENIELATGIHITCNIMHHTSIDEDLISRQLIKSRKRKWVRYGHIYSNSMRRKTILRYHNQSRQCESFNKITIEESP